MSKMKFILKFLLLPIVILQLSGCASSTIQRVDSDYWSRELSENALTTKDLSSPTRNHLALRGWDKKALRKPKPILTSLREELTQEPDRDGITVLAELAYWSGKKAKKDEERMAYLLTAARAAYAVLFDPGLGPMLDPLDPNLRFAADLYNYSLSLVIDDLLAKEENAVDPPPLPMMEGTLQVKRGTGLVDSPVLEETLVAFSYKTDALRLHNRRRGIGVPMVAVRTEHTILEGVKPVHPPVKSTHFAPATALLRFNDPWCKDGEVQAENELWNPISTSYIEIDGQSVPLEADTTLSLAMAYDKHADYRGLQNMLHLLRGAFVGSEGGLFLMEPYHPEKIPVVLTHGLMDTPLTWVPLYNELQSDPVLTDKYQFWVFFYPTMNPIMQSASELRQSLLSFHSELQAKDEAWDDMVLVGHSMGGLITRLMIVDSDQNFEGLRQRAHAASAGDADLQAYLQTVGTFEPLPFVHRAVFMGAPHAGANMADQITGRIGSSIITRPEYMREFIEATPQRAERFDKMENGIDNLAPESLFSLALKDSTWSTNLPVHSVIGDLHEAGSTNGTDGVVAYWSSHNDATVSELVIESDHMKLHKKIPSIAEVRRILLLHLEDEE